ncbi:MAG: radical SAM protein [Candidatus Hodarchaeota archaeon]
MTTMKQGRLFSTETPLTQNSVISVNEVTSKTILSKSGLYDIDFSINPYKGCQHNCAYCYACSMVERWGEKRQWGHYVDVKMNAPEVLQKQLRRINSGSVLISSVTDPYQPIEQHSRLTRRLLSILSGTGFHIVVLTKSALVSRDIDIFQENPHWEIGMTLTTANDAIRAMVEPQASPIEERLSVLRMLADAGVKTYAFLGPMLPFAFEDTLSELMEALDDVNVSYVMVDRLNVRGSNMKRLVPIIEKILPDRRDEFLKACRKDSSYFVRLKRRIRSEFALRGLQAQFCY